MPSPGDLPDLGIKPGSPALQADSLPVAYKVLLIILWWWWWYKGGGTERK